MAVEPLIPPDTAPPPPTKAVYGGFAYFKGAIVPFGEANVSIGTHALNYGTACFEGIRGYWNPEHQEIYVLKLAEHYQRFLKSTALLTEDANAAGYDDCLMLTEDGHIAEGSAANFFMIQGRSLVTPPVTDDILVGITRAAVMRLALDFELDVVERSIDRTEVYQADEAFLCGTGVQVASIVEVDGRPVGSGRPGTLTLGLQEAYFRAVRGADPRYRQWCTPVYGGMPRIT